ncbi:hypothetical protein C809_01649 [Lachnospiraceae bacterium MD335]|nr:hypothetical protein C809_01649 [Lachnospiraceae bacterium MD335]
MELICARPPISSYNFMRYLCASLVKRSKVIIDLDSITSCIYSFKRDNEQLKYMFEDIEFRTNIDNVISNDISEGINNLQTFGLVGKLNPKYEKLVIYLSTEEANEILKECTQEVEEAMMQLALCF